MHNKEHLYIHYTISTSYAVKLNADIVALVQSSSFKPVSLPSVYFKSFIFPSGLLRATHLLAISASHKSLHPSLHHFITTTISV